MNFELNRLKLPIKTSHIILFVACSYIIQPTKKTYVADSLLCNMHRHIWCATPRIFSCSRSFLLSHLKKNLFFLFFFTFTWIDALLARVNWTTFVFLRKWFSIYATHLQDGPMIHVCAYIKKHSGFIASHRYSLIRFFTRKRFVSICSILHFRSSLLILISAAVVH